MRKKGQTFIDGVEVDVLGAELHNILHFDNQLLNYQVFLWHHSVAAIDDTMSCLHDNVHLQKSVNQ